MSADACVATGRFDRPEGHPKGAHREARSWCGRELASFEWSFVDASHAALAAPHTAIAVCDKCIAAIKRSLDGESVLQPIQVAS